MTQGVVDISGSDVFSRGKEHGTSHVGEKNNPSDAKAQEFDSALIWRDYSWAPLRTIMIAEGFIL